MDDNMINSKDDIVDILIKESDPVEYYRDIITKIDNILNIKIPKIKGTIIDNIVDDLDIDSELDECIEILNKLKTKLVNPNRYIVDSEEYNEMMVEDIETIDTEFTNVYNTIVTIKNKKSKIIKGGVIGAAIGSSILGICGFVLGGGVSGIVTYGIGTIGGTYVGIKLTQLFL